LTNLSRIKNAIKLKMTKEDDYIGFTILASLAALLFVVRRRANKWREETLSWIQNDGQPPEDPADYDRRASTSERRKKKD